MKYYGICVPGKSLKHFKYLRREWKNGGWKYYYEDSENPTGVPESKGAKVAKKLESTRTSSAKSYRDKVYSELAKKRKADEEEAKKKAEEEAKKKADEEAKSTAEERAKARDARIAAQRDAAYRERQKKKKKATILRGQSAANNILLRRDYIK